MDPHRDAIRIIALGGYGEIGQNCTVFAPVGAHDALRPVMIDCGVQFGLPQGGVELAHPDWSILTSEPNRLGALLLTHGHEDHIGAVGFMLESLIKAGRTEPLDIFGPSYALAMAQFRLDEAEIAADAYRMVPLEPNETVTVAGWPVRPIEVAHSIAQAYAFAIDSPAGRVLHTGDFKLAANDDEAQVFAGLKPVRLLMSDSTGVLRDGVSGKEGMVADALSSVVASAKGRVFVSIFASNTHRLAAIGRAAIANGRRLCLLGMSVGRHVETARSLGLLDWSSSLCVNYEQAQKLDDASVMYIVSGTQGEPRGSLSRLAHGTHSATRLTPSDRVIMSSRIIPGNERAVFAMIDRLVGLGVELITRIDAPEIHATGHACKSELQSVIDTVAPETFIPIHGTRMHLKAHAALAETRNIEDILLIENGQVAVLHSEDRLERADGFEVHPQRRANRQLISDEVIRQRVKAHQLGFIDVWLDRGLQRALVSSIGVPEAAEVHRACERVAQAALRAHAGHDDAHASEMTRRAVRNAAEQVVKYRPPVRVFIVGDPQNV